jgi:hypothetical protein
MIGDFIIFIKNMIKWLKEIIPQIIKQDIMCLNHNYISAEDYTGDADGAKKICTKCKKKKYAYYM